MAPDVGRAGQMLRVLGPVPIGDVVEAQRGLGRRQLRDQPCRFLALGRLYFFGFTPRRAFRRAVKPMTSHLEVEVEIRRATVSVLVDGHGTSFRVWLAMNSLRSGSVNILRVRRLPWPMATYLSAPEATWPFSVLIEQPSLAAACAAVLSPSGGGWRGLRATGGGITCPSSKAARPRARRVAPGCSGTKRLAATT